MHWEYAFVHWEGNGKGQHRSVEFSHQTTLDRIAGTFPELVKKLGDDGWELVAAVPTTLTSAFDNSRATYVFKRPQP